MAGLFRQRQSRGYEREIWDAHWQRNADGQLVIAGGVLRNEVDTFTCLSCQQIVRKPPFMQPTNEAIGAWSYKLNGPICLRCAKNPPINDHMAARDFIDKVNENYQRLAQREKWT